MAATTPAPTFVGSVDPYRRSITGQPDVGTGRSVSGAGLDSIYQNQDQTVDWQMMSSLLHFDAESAYQQYLNQWMRTQPRDPETEGSRLSRVPTAAEWFKSALTSDSVSNIMSAIEIQWAQEGQGPMTPELRNQLEAAINGMDPAGRWSVVGMLQDAVARMTSFTSAVKGIFNVPAISNVVAAYEKAHPNLVQKALDLAATNKNNFITSFYNAFGKMPTQQQIDSIGAMDIQSQESWMDQQTYKFGIKLGDWNQMKSTVDSKYFAAFGHMPDDNTLAAYAGMNPTQIQDHINASPSNRVPGMNVGTYTSYHDTLSSAMKDAFGHDAPDELVKLFSESKP